MNGFSHLRANIIPGTLGGEESGGEGVQEGREGEGRGEEVKGGKGRGGEGRGGEGRDVRRCYQYDAFIDTPMSKRFVCNNYL